MSGMEFDILIAQEKMSDELKHPDEWAKVHGVQIIDPDGWRSPVAFGEFWLTPRPYDEPLPEAQFIARMIKSTITIKGR